MIIYGKHPVFELIKNHAKLVRELFISEKSAVEKDLQKMISEKKLHHNKLAQKELEKIAGTTFHQGVAARIEGFPYLNLEDVLSRENKPALLLALDSLNDPQNLGALIRSAAAFNFTAVFFPKDRNAQITPAVVKASAGTAFTIPIAHVTNLVRTLEELHEKHGFWAVGTASEHGVALSEFEPPERVVLVVGSEGEGLRKLVRDRCHFSVCIPISERVESLNASAAGAILMYGLSQKIKSL